MNPIWRLQFWSDLYSDLLLYTWKAAVPTAALWYDLYAAWNGVATFAAETANTVSLTEPLIGIAVGFFILDTFSGCWRAYTEDEFSLDGYNFERIFDKVAKYTITILVFGGLGAVAGEWSVTAYMLGWLADFGTIVVILKEGDSAFENMWGDGIIGIVEWGTDKLSAISDAKD